MVTRIELFERIRRDRRVDPNVSQRELMSRHAVSRRTVLQALNAALPPQRKRPIRGRPSQLAPVAEFIDAMLREDLNSPRKQKHTIMRICQRLADEYDFHEACYSTVRNYVTPRRKVLRAEAREGHAFLHGMVPQVHLPGEEAEVDFCEVTVDLAGRGPVKCFMFTLRLSFSGRAVHRVYASAGQESFMDGHIEAFRAIGGTPTKHIRYDNLKPAVKQVLFGRARSENQRWVAFRSHYGFEPSYCLPGVEGAHEKGGVEHEGGRFRRNYLVPVPIVASLSQLNDRLAEIDAHEDSRHVHGAQASIGERFAVEAPLLQPLPYDDFETGTTFTPRVARSSRVMVRQCYYSAPARFIDTKIRVELRANELIMYDGRQIVARHPRLTKRFDYSDILDHYLEILRVKPGAFSNAAALVQARQEGVFTPAHDAFWANARARHGERDGTRALIEVLLLHRQLPADAVIAGITATVKTGSCSPDLVAIEARKAAERTGLLPDVQPSTEPEPSDEDTSQDDEFWTGPQIAASASGAQVISLDERRRLTREHRPNPPSIYDQLLTRRSKGKPA